MQTSSREQVSGVTGGRILAYIVFNGTGTPAIRKSFNISSISDLGLGKYRLNFITPMLDTNFISVGASGNSAGFVDCEGTARIGARTTSYIEIACTTGGATNYYDPETVNVVVFS